MEWEYVFDFRSSFVIIRYFELNGSSLIDLSTFIRETENEYHFVGLKNIQLVSLYP